MFFIPLDGPLDGSPPRAWGIPPVVTRCWLRARFTPTCVGNTVIATLGGIETTVHPHVRGEYKMIVSKKERLLGSPPRAWGILVHTLRYSIRSRFTPTCVGNT